MPKIVSPDSIDKFLRAIAEGDNQGVAAKQFGFTSGTVSIWIKRKPEFAERLRAAHEAGKVARRARVRTQTRQMLVAMCAPAHDGPPAPEQVSQLGIPESPQQSAQRRVPIGRVDAHGILWCDPELLQMAMREAARALGRPVAASPLAGTV